MVVLIDLGYDKSYIEIIFIIYEWIFLELIGCCYILMYIVGKVF